jgi:hypothetical protein
MAVSEVERERKRRAGLVARATAGPLLESAYWRARPALEPGLQLRQAAVLADGEFEAGYVLKRPGGGADLPISMLVATALTKADGARSLGEIVVATAAEMGLADATTLAEPVAAAFRILYIDGTVRELRGIES